jgi:hypothetical protein
MYGLSIVVSNGGGVTLEFEVVGVVFLNMVSEFRVRHIVTPSHRFSESNGIGELSEFHVHVVSLVGVAQKSVGIVLAAPSHKVRLEGASVREIKSPVFANLFVSRVAVQVLLLGHVNSANLVSVYLSIPRVSPDSLASRAQRVFLSSLVSTETLGVLGNIIEFISSSRNTCALDSTIDKSLTVRVKSSASSMNVH